MAGTALEAVDDYSELERRSRPDHTGSDCISTSGSFRPSVGLGDRRRADFARAGDQNGRRFELGPSSLNIREEYYRKYGTNWLDGRDYILLRAFAFGVACLRVEE